jgi:hypothetical protein
MWWWWCDALCTRTTRIVGLFMVLIHWNNSLRIDMSPNSDTLSWFRANQSLLFLLMSACLVNKQQIPSLYSLVWPDRCSNPRSTTLKASTLTITPPMRFVNSTAIRSRPRRPLNLFKVLRSSISSDYINTY